MPQRDLNSFSLCIKGAGDQWQRIALGLCGKRPLITSRSLNQLATMKESQAFND